MHSGRATDAQGLAPDEAGLLSIALTPVSRVLPAGARLRFSVAGADPRQRNLQDIRIEPAPELTLLRGGIDASRVELPLAN